MYIDRIAKFEIARSLSYFPVTAITGSRQCGKSTLAKRILSEAPAGIYLDLERPSDIQRLTNAELFLSSQKEKLICIDEIQRMPNLFPLIRSLVDEWNRPGAFLILGSASRDMLKQSSESLAGRVSYHRLTPFLWDEIKTNFSFEQILTRGSYPNSLLAPDAALSYQWRENFIATFLERDILQWTGASPDSIRRLWQMLAHLNGQTANYSKIASSLGVSDNTVKNQIDLLSSTYMVEIVPSHFSNIGKRLVKAPKIYIADSGITATLLGLRSYEDILGYPGYGAMWEQIVLTNIRGNYPTAEIFHYRSSGGAEVDFIVKIYDKIFAIECKASLSPTLSKGVYSALEDIKPAHTFVVIPSKEGWIMSKDIDVLSINNLGVAMQNYRSGGA
ncbi:ATPase [Campylobacterota bacterium]|nr:ATPase [Campylobacterota bacterium]